MAVIVCNGLDNFARRFRRDMLARQRRVERAVAKTAKDAASDARPIIKKNIPVAFGELRESVHVEGTTIVVDAPHAAAVENGSRPHLVPLEDLVKWVKLRARQGLLTPRQQGRLPGPTTRKAAKSIAAQVRSLSGSDSTDIEIPMQIAKAIQDHILKFGTKPYHYMLRSLPEIQKHLDELVRAALPDTKATEASEARRAADAQKPSAEFGVTTNATTGERLKW